MKINGKEVDFKISRLEDAGKYELALQHMQKTEAELKANTEKRKTLSEVIRGMTCMFQDFFGDIGHPDVLKDCNDLEVAKCAYLEFLKEVAKQKEKVLTFTLDDIK